MYSSKVSDITFAMMETSAGGVRWNVTRTSPILGVPGF